jgi:hypothetical protein
MNFHGRRDGFISGILARLRRYMPQHIGRRLMERLR